jgi:stearoyl-CoA desaturase (delta-9 desaturase)
VVLGIIGIAFFSSLTNFAVFVVLAGVTICAGHSVGMHRLLIHRSFEAPLWVEFSLVWLGTLVGMQGPSGMIRAHDLRDWHQRQTVCPAHPSHDARFWQDAWWQLCCEFQLDHPPRLNIEDRVSQSVFYRWLDRWWMAQQMPLACGLWMLGGWGMVLWGVSLRIAVSLFGHWAIGHFAHRQGQQGWQVSGLPVQGYNLPRWSILTFGENWHGNHHAFPHSAKLGVERGQLDLGYWLIAILGRLGLAHNIQLPDSAPAREGLQRLG